MENIIFEYTIKDNDRLIGCEEGKEGKRINEKRKKKNKK